MFRGLIELGRKVKDTGQTVPVIAGLLQLSTTYPAIRNFMFTMPLLFLSSSERGQSIPSRIVNSCSSQFCPRCYNGYTYYAWHKTQYLDKVPDFDLYYNYFVDHQRDVAAARRREADRQAAADRKRAADRRRRNHPPWGR